MRGVGLRWTEGGRLGKEEKEKCGVLKELRRGRGTKSLGKVSHGL